MDTEHPLPVPYTGSTDSPTQVLTNEFINSLRKAPTPALRRCTRTAISFIRLQLYGGMIVWGRTYRLYRKMVRGRHSKVKLEYARMELRMRIHNHQECCPWSYYLLGSGNVPTDKPLFRT